MLKELLKLFVFVFFLIPLEKAFATVRTFEASVSLSELFAPQADWQAGIIGNISGGGTLTVKIYYKESNTLVYQATLTSTATTYSGVGVNYKRSDLGSGATCYPDVWNSLDIETALFAIERKRRKDDGKLHSYLSGGMTLLIEITENQGSIQTVKIPGIGIADRDGGNALFYPDHYCYDLKHNADPITKIWKRLKMPRLDQGADVLVAAHRGFWGDNLGAGYPENSTGAFEAAQKYTDVLETDIMITKDKRMVISHDYSLSRLSNYSGPLTDYLFDLNSNILDGLFLRKRNTDVSMYPYLFFEDVVDILLQRKMVLTVDIKDVRARRVNGQCVANCEYDPATHGDAAKLKIKESWMTCFRTCIKIAEEKGALQYLAFKTPFTYDELAAYVPETTLCKLLFMPVIQPKRKDFLDFTDGWINRGGKKVIAYETNFLNEGDPYLQSFTRDGVRYENLLHYVYKKTGLRSGCYPEEPIGQMGTVTRWVEWKMKYTVNDRRGDHYWLMAVPYGKIMVMTSDRPDIWYKVNQIYNMTGQ